MKYFFISIVALSILGAGSPILAAPITTDLEGFEVESLLNGDNIVKPMAQPGSSWPTFVSYVFVKAPLDWALALNFNYSSHAKIVSSLSEVEVVNQISPAKFQIRYVFPFLGLKRLREEYIAEEEATCLSPDESYLFSFNKIVHINGKLGAVSGEQQIDRFKNGFLSKYVVTNRPNGIKKLIPDFLVAKQVKKIHEEYRAGYESFTPEDYANLSAAADNFKNFACKP